MEKTLLKKITEPKENRVKRLSKDKAIYKKTLDECLTSFPAWFEADNQEVKDFSMECHIEVIKLRDELLTKLENL